MRIAFTGPESSGKTSFSKWLCNELAESVYYPEFARSYLEENKLTRASEYHFKEIVKGQCALFISPTISTHQIFDTDIFVLRIWNDEVFKLQLTELDLHNAHKMDIHFLCAPDIEWEEDPLRNAPEQDYRDKLFIKYKTELNHHRARFVILSGNVERKKEMILSSIQEFISNSPT
jgi:nicotinamide riboside kinase